MLPLPIDVLTFAVFFSGALDVYGGPTVACILFRLAFRASIFCYREELRAKAGLGVMPFDSSSLFLLL